MCVYVVCVTCVRACLCVCVWGGEWGEMFMCMCGVRVCACVRACMRARAPARVCVCILVDNDTLNTAPLR